MKRLVFAVLLLIPGLALAATAPPTAPQILAQAKAASGGAAWNDVHSLRIEATVKLGGLEGGGTVLDDLLTGRSVMHGKLGPITVARGFDGNQGWTKAPGGEVAPDNSPAAKKSDATSAYQAARAWWFPARWPGKVVSLGTKTDAGKTFQVLRITPRGGHPFEMWINAKTHLIARTVDRSGVLPMTTYFSDYRTVDGVKIAFRQRSSNGKKQYDQLLQLTKVAVNVPVSAKDFAMPRQKLNDFSFIGGGGEATIPFQLVNNHIYIPVSVNGQALHFMVDTGGANILTREAATRAGIESKGALQGGGVGKKSVNVGLGKVAKLILGKRVELQNQNFSIFPMPGFGDVEGTEFDGLVGYELFKRFVIRVDYADQKLTFIKKADFKPASAGTAVAFTSSGGGIPLVHGSIDGIEGVFEIDTGSRAALSLWAPFAKAHDLDSRYHATGATTVGWGVGGSANAHVARGGVLKIGAVTINDPVVELSTSTKGAGADKHIAGNIGGEILKRFTVTFDYAHQRMYLKPNKYYGTPMNYDRSGLWINRHDNGFVVKSVMAGSPADKAGLEPGDLITAVNGKSTAELDLAEFRAALRDDAPGTRLKLTVKDGETTRQATLALQRLIPETGGLGGNSKAR